MDASRCDEFPKDSRSEASRPHQHQSRPSRRGSECEDDVDQEQREFAGMSCSPAHTTVLEEKIEEEITTTYPEEHVEEAGDSQACDHFVELNLVDPPMRVPFPELGLDVVDVNLASLFTEELKERMGSGIRLTDLASWEENWLFQKKRKTSNSVCPQYAFTELDLAAGPVRMLIPNPNMPAETCIGETDVDQLSELSERNSGSSLTFSDDEGDELDNDQEIQVIDSRVRSRVRRVSEPVTEDEAFVDAASPSEDNPQVVPMRPQPATSIIVPIDQYQSHAAKAISVFPKYSANAALTPIPVPKFVPLDKRMESARTDPSFVIKPCGASVQTDIVVQFCCRVKGSRPLAVAWFKNDQELRDDRGFRVFSCGSEYVLEIKSTKLEQTDTYSCVVYNQAGEEWADFNLLVKQVRERHRPTLLARHAIKSPESEDEAAEKKEDASRAKEKGLRNEDASSGNSQGKPTPPVVIQRTWAERSASLQENQDEDMSEGESDATHPGSGPCQQKRLPSFPISEREHKKWESSPVSWPENPYTRENASKRKERPVVYSSEESGFNSMPPGVSAEDEESEASISVSKDMSRYKRDYYVPTKLPRYPIEALNSTDETQVCQFYAMKSKEGEVHPTSPDVNQSGLHEEKLEPAHQTRRSSISNGSSSLALDCLDEEEDKSSEPNSTRTTSSAHNHPLIADEGLSKAPSVRNLVKQFSRESSKLKRSSTFSSTRTYHEDCSGKGVIPRMNSIGGSFEVHSLTARSLKKEFRENNQRNLPRALNRLGSLSLYDIDQVTDDSQRSSSPGTGTATTCSPTNAGYASDESNGSSGPVKGFRTVVEVKSPRKGSRAIMKRASFWQKRCEQGLLSDSSVNEDFPPVESLPYE